MPNPVQTSDPRLEKIHTLLMRFEDLLESPVFFFDYDARFSRLRLTENTAFSKTHDRAIPFCDLTEIEGCRFSEASLRLRNHSEFREWVMKTFQLAYFEAFPWWKEEFPKENRGAEAPAFCGVGKRFQGVFLVLHPRPSCLSSEHEDKIRSLLRGDLLREIEPPPFMHG